MCSLSHLPCITIPTRESENTSSIIDHIWSNVIDNVDAGVIKTNITDHCTTFCYFSGLCRNRELIVRRFRDCSGTCMNAFRDELTECLSDFHLYDGLNVEIRCKIFHTILFNAYNKCCPIRTKVVSSCRLSRPWFDNDMMTLCNRKHALFRQYRAGVISFGSYNSYKNKFTTLLKRVKLIYFRDKFEHCKNNLSKTWKNVNKLLGSCLLYTSPSPGDKRQSSMPSSA